ncbi:protein kinase [Streptomyces sp. ACA25]|uniref:protein kinase domain-containing protein n=1 Tax=Streptomyces sp. ACA25 TaxID=3022596 RepID=UPI002306DD43|nr:protein kinase [Streptomyces sp. ACA25]MDB1086349.1 protein kinase [Streptomyces sp. ACA25]
MSDQAAQQPADHTGRAVGGGRYQLRSLLGRGGMASVHLAYDTVLDRQIAVKTMHGELGQEDSFRERFRREAQSVAKLTHPNIVSVFDTGEDILDGVPVPYIVMEFVDGRPLRDVLDEDIARHGAMPADKALKIIKDVCAALDMSHEMGLVHRDIKPGNVMLTKRGEVKVMDFGIARAMQSGVTSMTQTGMVVGTPQYLSPEQALGRGVDARSDLYSVGIMLFELLTGRLPFEADSPLAIAYAHVQEEPPTPSHFNSAVPPAVDGLVARMLRKNPNERFADAATLRTECERVSGSLTGTAPQITGAAPAASGAAVSQTVFPQYGAATPPPGAHVQSPYALGSPPPGAGAYGYPHPPTAVQQGVHTPPPYHLNPAAAPAVAGGGKGGGNRSMTLLVAAGVLALVLIAGTAMAYLLSGGSDDSPEAKGDTSGQSGGAEDVDDDPEPTDDDKQEREPRFKEGDPEKTIDPKECVNARDHYNEDEHPDAIVMPDFYDKHFASVKECIRQAKWIAESPDLYEDEVLKGKGMVVDQSPKKYEPFNPEEDKIQLTISTGNER